jgi:hypothetical protein
VTIKLEVKSGAHNDVKLVGVKTSCSCIGQLNLPLIVRSGSVSTLELDLNAREKKVGDTSAANIRIFGLVGQETFDYLVAVKFSIVAS